MICSGKFYGMQVSMTQQSGNFWKIIFTTITHNKRSSETAKCYTAEEVYENSIE